MAANPNYRLTYINNAETTIVGSPSAGTTSITVADGSVFGSPSTTNRVVASIDDGTNPTEIVHITGVAANVLTVVRGQESTTARSYLTGHDVKSFLTAGMMADSDPLGNSSADGGVQIGRTADCTDANSVAIGDGALANGSASASVAVGNDAESTSTDTTAIGRNAKVDSTGSTAVGSGAECLHDTLATAVGNSAHAKGESSSAVGNYAETEAAGTFRPWGPQIMQRTIPGYYYDSAEAPGLMSASAVIYSPPVDLGPGIAWSATTFKDGEVCEPTVPSGTEQFYLVTNVGLDDYDYAPTTTNQITETATQPTWDITDQGDATNSALSSAHKWIYIDPEVGITIAANALSYAGAGSVAFFPVKAGFICSDYATLTTPPDISIGNQTNNGAYLNSVSLSDIDANNTMHWFDVNSTNGTNHNDGATTIKFLLDTRGIGASGKCQGRFFVEGYYMQLQG